MNLCIEDSEWFNAISPNVKQFQLMLFEPLIFSMIQISIL